MNELASHKTNVTIVEAKKKWGNLVQTYNKAKDIKTRTGKGPVRFLFFDNIDSILGYKPSNSSPYSLNLGSVESGPSTSKNSCNIPVTIVESIPSGSKSTDDEIPEVTGNKSKDIENVHPETTGPTKFKKRKRENPTGQYLKFKKEFYNKLQEDREKAREEKRIREEKNKKGLIKRLNWKKGNKL